LNVIQSDEPIETRVVAIKTEIEEGPSRYKELYPFLDKLKSNRNPIVLSIILPMFNEEKTIGSVLDSLPSNDSIEIIVVNDHSTDNSLAEIESVQRYKPIHVINHPKNKGYGAAILSGVNQAKGEIIVTMDSDGQHSPDDILTLIRPIIEKKADYTIGSRYLGSYFYQLPVSTRLGEVVLEKFIQILFHRKIKNNQNGFRAFNRKVISIFRDLKYEGYAFCTEQILKASIEGYTIKECPIKLYDREFGASHIILRKLAVNIFTCFFIYYLRKIQFMALKKNKAGMLKIHKSPQIYRPNKKMVTYEGLIQCKSFIFIERKNFLSA
jgi:glycosyltransferase involved in cell wall biosynthesis